MATYVLIHGGGGSAWDWHLVAPELRARGHDAVAMDLPSRGGRRMKKLDIIAAALVIVGGLNWGLVAVAEFDLVATIFGLEFGETNAASRIVSVAAVYQILQQAGIRRRWSRDPHVASA